MSGEMGKVTTGEVVAVGFDYFQGEVGRWAAATFPDSTPMSKARHLLREAGEVGELSAILDLLAAAPPEVRQSAAAMVEAIEEELRPQLAEECADVLLILLHIAHSQGFSLLAEARRKFTENQLRKWGKADAQGVAEHERAE